MKRRDLLAALAGTVLLPGTLHAQKAIPVIGYLSNLSRDTSAPFVAAFRQGLSETGYVDGSNVTIEHRWGEGRYDRQPALAADLVARKVDVIVAGGTPSARAAKNATSTIPIVFTSGDDPVEDGLVASLALTAVFELALFQPGVMLDDGKRVRQKTPLVLPAWHWGATACDGP